MYRRRTAAEDSAILRFSPADEYAKTAQEANLLYRLYWASSLMEFTYSAIRHRASQTDQETLPVTIPYLRFVHAGVPTSPMLRPFEEHIWLRSTLRRHQTAFVKFVHNGDANPLLDHDDPLYDIAEFLCFTQHLQYFKTDGAVFVSDFQSMSATLLTDPQIMTSPFANGKDLFGDGNVASVFEKFPEQHHCNEYCTWFGLPEFT
ncbi:hypothetical protein C8J57DRAFT_1055025 [Mycena rebaudengoi]|nr:hypothetical protein C8J57DRAFT_1055025 [Mycena rebaudengoi]